MNSQRAFTLVELSIVLVILGLLAGGVVAGQSLIRSAALRSIASQDAQFLGAVTAFKDKYNFLPGDLPNATEYWGAVDADPSACMNGWAASTDHLKTCNGDGDGIVGTTDVGIIEGNLFWQQLSNAQMLDGGYSPLNPLPKGRVRKSQWTTGYYGTFGSAGNYFDGTYEHVFALSVMNETTPVLKPVEAWNIDTKIDDGKPALGNFIVRGDNAWAGPGDPVASCTTASTSADINAEYKTDYSELGCSPLFAHQY